MNFIINDKGVEAVNVAFVKKFYIDRRIYDDGITSDVSVWAEMNDEDAVILKEFNSDNTDENISAAKKYLAELIKTLNGGQL